MQPFLGARRPILAALQVILKSLWIGDPDLGESLLLLRRHMKLNLLRDVASNVGLELQHVAHLAIIAFGPEMLVRGGID